MEIDLSQLPIPDWGLNCPKCRYPLRGLPSHRCPECGLQIDVPSLVRPWTRLRGPRFTGEELPFPDFGLACRKCGAALAGAKQRACGVCGAAFDPHALRPAGEWFAVEPWMGGGLSMPIMETILANETIPYVTRDDKTLMDIYFGPRSISARLVVPCEFFFELLWLAGETRREMVRTHSRTGAGEWHCPKCGEDVPWNFDVCWNCEEPRMANG